MAVSAAKAAALAGGAYRDNLDRQIIRAMRRHGWLAGQWMVTCESLNADGAKRFFVRVCYSTGWPSEELTVSFDLSGDEFRAAREESFEIVGKILAKKANEELEAKFMEFD